MKTVLITGGTGFVGANLVRRLVRDGHQVHLLVRAGHQAWRLQGVEQDLQMHEAILSDAASVDRIVRQVRPQWIFHLAVAGAYSWQKDLDEMVKTNIQGTINLVRAAQRVGVEVLVNTGSSSEYGYKNHPPDEETFLEPNSHYAVTKASATLFCRYTAQQDKVRIPTLRLYSAFGPFEDPNRLLPKLLVHGLRGGFPPLVNPDIARDYVYVEDVVEAFLKAATVATQDYGAVLNVGTGKQVPLREIVEVVRNHLAIRATPAWGTMPARSWDTTSWVANAQRIRSELGWEPRFSLDAGFQAFAAWYRANPQWQAIYEQAA